jgi:hypothetical protein
MAPSCNKADLMRSEFFNQAGRSGHLSRDASHIRPERDRSCGVIEKQAIGSGLQSMHCIHCQEIINQQEVWAAEPEQKVQHTYSAEAPLERERRASEDG